jgi:TonB family protein
MLIISSPTFAANWQEIPNSKGSKLYLDISNINIAGNNYVSYWINFKTEDNRDNKMLLISDYKNNTVGILTTIKTNAKGIESKNIKDKYTFKLTPLIAGSIAESAHNYACQLIFNPPFPNLNITYINAGNNYLNTLDNLINNLKTSEESYHIFKEGESVVTSEIILNNATKDDVVSLLKSHCDGNSRLDENIGEIKNCKYNNSNNEETITFYKWGCYNEETTIPCVLEIQQMPNSVKIHTITSLFLIQNDYNQIFNYLRSYYPNSKINFDTGFYADFIDNKIENSINIEKTQEIIVSNAHKFDINHLLQSMLNLKNINEYNNQHGSGIFNSLNWTNQYNEAGFANNNVKMFFTVHQRNNDSIITLYKSTFLIQNEINNIMKFLRDIYPEVYIKDVKGIESEKVKIGEGIYQKPFLGVYVYNKDKNTVGIKEIYKDTPAEKAGLRKDDIIYKIGVNPITHSNQIPFYIQQMSLNSIANIYIKRNGHDFIYHIKLDKIMPDSKENSYTSNPNINNNKAKEPDFGPYMRALQTKIKRNWSPPKGEESKRVILFFKIAKDGRLLSLKVVRTSGSPEADRAALSAVELSEPFRALPPEYRDNDIDIQFSFEYDVVSGNRR